MRKRKDLIEFSCDHCSKPAWKKRSEVNKYKKKFCSIECHRLNQFTLLEVSCSFCQSPVLRQPAVLKRSKNGRAFCNRTCATKFNNTEYKSWEKNPNFKGGKSRYRLRALKIYGSTCSNSNCPIEKAGIEIVENMLDVDHVDSNRDNNDISNLQVLCVWCHALKTRVNW